MEYVKLVAGILLLVAFGWLLLRRKKRKGFIAALFDVDIIIGFVAGMYLAITSVISLFGS